MITIIIISALLCAGAVATLIGARMIEKRYPPRGRWVAAGGLRQHVVELGAASAGKPPIVLLHGAGCNLEDLRPIGERLAAAHHVILVDRPGQGWSEGGSRATCSPAAQAAILRDVLDQLGVARTVLIGHSWGGTLALAFALDHPDRAAGLVLLAPPTHPHLHQLTCLYGALSLPLAGWLFARTVALPLSAAALPAGVRGAFIPQTPPPGYLAAQRCMAVAATAGVSRQRPRRRRSAWRSRRAVAALQRLARARCCHQWRPRRRRPAAIARDSVCRCPAWRQARATTRCGPHAASCAARADRRRDRDVGWTLRVVSGG